MAVASLMGRCMTEETRDMGIALNLRATAAKVVPCNRSMELLVAGNIRRLGDSPSQLADALTKGIGAIELSVKYFLQVPPEIPEGISVLGVSLLEAIDMILTPEGKAAWLGYHNFTQAWIATFHELPDTVITVHNITQDLQMFLSTGTPKYLTKALTTMLDVSSTAVRRFAPGEIGKEIFLYLSSLQETTASWSEAIVDFENGDTAAGIEDIYFGIRGATEPWVPPQLQTDDTYNVIIGTADIVMGSLSRNVLEYRQRKLESKVCWKTSQRRDRTRPAVCTQGYNWDGESHCWPATEACWRQGPSCAASFIYKERMYDNCTMADHHTPWCSHNLHHELGQWSNCIRVPCEDWMTSISTPVETSLWNKRPAGTLPALCNASSSHPDKIDHWCFAACPAGYYESGTKCWTDCQGFFPAGSDLMCGRDPGAIAEATSEMVASVARAAVTVGLASSKISTLGVDPVSLAATIQAFVDMGKPFFRPLCRNM